MYECILKNKDFYLDFFQDSSTDEDEAAVQKNDTFEEENEDSSGPEEVLKAFKFNQDHCLHVFNTIKLGGNPANANNQFEQRGSGHFNS